MNKPCEKITAWRIVYRVNDSIFEKRPPTCNRKLQSIASFITWKNIFDKKILAEHQKKLTNNEETSIFEEIFWASIPKLSRIIAMCRNSDLKIKNWRRLWVQSSPDAISTHFFLLLLLCEVVSKKKADTHHWMHAELQYRTFYLTSYRQQCMFHEQQW